MQTLRKVFGSSRKREGSSITAEKAPFEEFCYVTPRIVVTARPTARETDRDDTRVNSKDLATWLERTFGDNYLIWNLSSKNRNTIDYGLFKNQVQEFQPFSRVDMTDETPAIGQVFRILYTLKFFLEWDPATTVIIHCNTGVQRTGFILACYLAYEGIHPSVESGLAAFSQARLGDNSLRDSLLPSWRYLLAHMDKALRAPPSLPKVHALSYIVLSAPVLRGYIRGNDMPVIQLFAGPKCVFDSSLDCCEDETIRWEGDKLVVELEGGGEQQHQQPGTGDANVDPATSGLVLCGDYQLWLLLPGSKSSRRDGGSPTPRNGPSLRDLGASSSDTIDLASGVSMDSGLGGQRGIGSGGRGNVGGGGAAARDPRRGSGIIHPSRIIARFCFHTSMLDPGVATVSSSDIDIFRSSLVDAKDASSLSLSLILADVPPETLASTNLDRLMQRSFMNLRGMRALQQGANDFSSHHYVFPAPDSLKVLVKEGCDEVAAVCALQRSNNAMGRCREVLDCPAFKEIFKESAAMRDLQLLRATLTMDEIAAVLSARANMAVKKRGVKIGDLDFSGLLEAAKLGELKPDGAGGTGNGKGKGGGGRGGRRKKKKKGAHGDSSDSSGSESDRGLDSDEEAADEDEEEDAKRDAADELIGSAAGASKLFANDADAKDADEEEEEEVEEEEEGGEDWTMKDHPIFGRWFKALSEGKSKADVIKDMLVKDAWNPALLDLPPDALVPEIPATTCPLKDWPLLEQFAKMSKVGLPRPMVEHAMSKQFLNPTLLDADPGKPPPANSVTPPRKKKDKGPQIMRKKLHWVPIRGKIEGTIWAGPPGDLIAAAAQLITDEKEFARLFILTPEQQKKKAKAKDNGGIIQLVDQKRAMNAGIALAKLKMPIDGVVACLSTMCARSGKHLLTGVELQNLVSLSPSEDEIKLVKGFKGDVKRLGPAEKFFLAVADVPACRARAQGLLYQYNFDDRVKEARNRVKLFAAAIAQIRGADRFQRLLKAVLVLGNKMNGIDKEHRKGIVKAFTVNSLHQLAITKTFGDIPVTVLSYFIKLLKRVDPDLLRLSRDFKGSVLAEAKRLPLDVMASEMREMREGLTSVEAMVREAAQGGAGMAGVMASSSSPGTGGGPQYADEEVEVEGAAGGGKGDAGGGNTNASPAAAGGGGGGGGGDGADGGTGTPADGGESGKAKKTKKRIRRRVEPLPAFASLAQTELGGLQTEFDAAQGQYKDLVRFFKEDGEMGADELFGNIHLFIQTFDNTLRLLVDKKRKEKEARRRAKADAKRKAHLAAKKKKQKSRQGGKGSDDDEDSDTDSDEEEEEEQSSSSSSSSSSATSADSDSSSDFGHDGGDDTDDEGGGGAGKPKATSAWANVPAGQAGADDDDDEEAEDAHGRSSSNAAAPANPMGGLFAAIKAKGGNASGEGSGSGTPASSAGSASGGDPRGGLLAAIKAKAGGGAGTGSAGGSPASSAASSSKGAAPSSTKAAAADVAAASSDPRASMLAAIAGRAAAKQSATAGTPASSSPSPAKAAAPAPSVTSPVTDDAGGDGDPRNAMLAAIARRKKE